MALGRGPERVGPPGSKDLSPGIMCRLPSIVPAATWAYRTLAMRLPASLFAPTRCSGRRPGAKRYARTGFGLRKPKVARSCKRTSENVTSRRFVNRVAFVFSGQQYPSVAERQHPPPQQHSPGEPHRGHHDQHRQLEEPFVGPYGEPPSPMRHPKGSGRAAWGCYTRGNSGLSVGKSHKKRGARRTQATEPAPRRTTEDTSSKWLGE